MKSFSQLTEDIATRRKLLKQRQLKLSSDFKDRTTGAHQRVKDEAAKKSAYKKKVRAEVEKEIENES